MSSFHKLLIQTSSEVDRSLSKARDLYEQWSDLQPEVAPNSRDEFDSVTIELRNSLRSIEWDLEDLEEALNIVEMNPKKFKFESDEIKARKEFIESTREEVDLMKKSVAEVTGKAPFIAPSKKTKEKRTIASLLPHNGPSYSHDDPYNVDLGHRSVYAPINGNASTLIRKVSNSMSDLVDIVRREDELTVSMIDHEGGHRYDQDGNVIIVTGSSFDYFCKRVSQFFRTQSKRSIFVLILIAITFILATGLILGLH